MAWFKKSRAGTGLLGVPKLPPHYLERPEDLEPLKRAVLEKVGADKLGITGKSSVGVQGMGGVGKTVLAATVARDKEVLSAFPDGVLWVPVGQTPDLVALQAELAAAGGHPEPVFASIHQGKRELERLFKDRRTLLVADDVWKVDHAAAFDVVGGAGRLLITTRNREIIVALGAREHRLDVLEPKQALALLADWSGQDARELPEVAVRVAKACGYLPLALAMIGAMVQHRPAGWDDALSRLDRADLDKIRRGFPDYPYPDLLRALEVSVEALEPEDRERYLELAVFREDETIPEVALATLWSAADMDDLDTRDLIHRLANRSLASLASAWQGQPTTYAGGLKLHDLQRDYVCHRAVRSLTVLHQRLIDAYARRCDDGWSTGPDDSYYFQRLPFHLMHARRSGELRALLLEFRWLRAKLNAEGVAALISDFDLLPGREDLRQVQGALRLAAHILIQHPEQLAGQLLGRLQPDPEAPGIAGLLQGALEGGEEHSILLPAPVVSLRPRTATLTPPGGPLLATLEGWVRAVTALADGRLVTASEDGTLRLWDLEHGEAVATIEAHRGPVHALAALTDGRLVTASEDGTLRLWDLKRGVALATLEGHADSVAALAALTDGRLVSAGVDGTLRLWDLERGVAVATLESHRGVSALAVLADGRLVSAGGDGTLRLWDLAAGAVIATREGHGGWVNGGISAVAALADGRLVSAGVDGTLCVWDLDRGEPVATLKGHTDSIRAVAALADGRLVSAGVDGTLRLWDLDRGEAVATLEGHTGWVTAVAAFADGRLVSAGFDGTLRLWDLAAGATVALEGHRGRVHAVAALIDGRIVSASDDGTLCLWDLERGVADVTLEGHSDSIRAVAALADGRFVSAGFDGTLRLWDLDREEAGATLEGHTGGVSALAVLADGRLVSAGFDGTLRLWDLAAGEAVATLEGHRGQVRAMAALADGRLVSAGGDHTLRLWDLAAGEAVADLDGHTDSVSAVTVLADGRLVSASDDGTLRLWDLEHREAVATLGHSGGIRALAALADGRLVSACGDRTLRLWDLAAGEIVAVFTLDAPPLTVTTGAGGVVIAGDARGRVHFFDVVE